jgi:hypothetical protein
VGSCGPGASGSGWGPVVSSCEHGSEPSGSMRLGGIQNQSRRGDEQKFVLLLGIQTRSSTP